MVQHVENMEKVTRPRHYYLIFIFVRHLRIGVKNMPNPDTGKLARVVDDSETLNPCFDVRVGDELIVAFREERTANVTAWHINTAHAARMEEFRKRIVEAVRAVHVYIDDGPLADEMVDRDAALKAIEEVPLP